jgi:hypothetical protein
MFLLGFPQTNQKRFVPQFSLRRDDFSFDFLKKYSIMFDDAFTKV